MVEKVVKNNFFHHFREKNLPQKFVEKVEKKVSNTTFSLTQAVLEAQIVEKVVFDNFFHHFFDSKDFLRNSWKKWKKLSKTTFSTTQAVLEAQIVEKVVFDNFFHHFYDSKDFLNNSWNYDSKDFLKNSWKKLAWPTFSTTQAVLEAQIVEKVGQANFLRVLPILSMLEEEPPHFVLRNAGALLLFYKREALFPT